MTAVNLEGITYSTRNQKELFFFFFCKHLNCLKLHRCPKGGQQGATVWSWVKSHVTWRQWSTHSSDLNFLFFVAGRGDEDEEENKFAAGATIVGEFSCLPSERLLPAVKKRFLYFALKFSICFCLCAKNTACQWPYPKPHTMGDFLHRFSSNMHKTLTIFFVIIIRLCVKTGAVFTYKS